MKIRYLIFLCIAFYELKAQLQPISSGVINLRDLNVQKENGLEYKQIAKGTTAELSYFEIRFITLENNQKSQRKTNKDLEEIIILKEGIAKCILGNMTTILGKGSVILILPHENQVIENVGDGPMTYYLLSSRSKKVWT